MTERLTRGASRASLRRMAMTTCRECAHDVSDQARSCPHCGSPRGTEAGTVSYWSREVGKLLVAMLVLGLLLAVISS